MTSPTPPPADSTAHAAEPSDVADLEVRLAASESARAETEIRLERALAELQSLRNALVAQGESPSINGTTPAAASEDFSLFHDPLTSRPTLAADGSDPGVLPVALGGTAVVAAMVVIITAFNGRLAQPFGIAMIAITVALAYFAWATRVERIQVSLSKGGIVYVERSGSGALRFDLRSDASMVKMVGEPGSGDWEMNFSRRGLEPFTVTDAMVDAADFTRRVRFFRPEV